MSTSQMIQELITTIKTDETAIKNSDIINVILKTLRYLNPNFIDHGERTAYLAYLLFEANVLSPKIERKPLLLLSLFHDIGAFKSETFDEYLLTNDTNTTPHAVYGYLFLKHFSPLGNYAESILYHHVPYKNLKRYNSSYQHYTEVIYLVDRIDVWMQQYDNETVLYQLNVNRHTFNETLLTAFLQLNQKKNILEQIRTKKYEVFTRQLYHLLQLSNHEIYDYLMTLLYTADFKSEQTVTHTISNASISLTLAELLNVSPNDYPAIYLGALLHDIGKLAIPPEILESKQRLSTTEMATMRDHVYYTNEIIKDIVSDEILKIAIRHHERLDGSGYPYGLTEKDLSFNEQIVACADVFSALISCRSYKPPFKKENVIEILTLLKESYHLNALICETIIEHYDVIVDVSNALSEPILRKYYSLSSEYKIKSKTAL